MEKVGQTLANSQRLTPVDQAALLERLLKDNDVAAFIAERQLTSEEIERSLPKFNQYCLERDRFLSGDAAYLAKGYQPILTMNEGYADVTYQETKALVQAQKQAAIKNRVTLVNLPKAYKTISLQDVDLADASRLPALTALVDFIDKAPSQGQKGLYLYGDMGIGKSFMLAALAHELSEKKGMETTMIHFPSFAIDVKNAIKTSGVKEMVDQLKTAQVLILDDIGAEQTSPWVRDEVLQVILQYRMLEELPTFFSSNYSLADLERKLADGKNGDETWQAQRVMERVRFLAQPLHLQGENRR